MDAQITRIQQDLQQGDRRLVANLSGVPYRTVLAILAGDRSANTKQGVKVTAAARALIRSRKSLLNQYVPDAE